MIGPGSDKNHGWVVLVGCSYFRWKLCQKKHPVAWYVASRGGGKVTLSRFPFLHWKFGGLPKKHPVLYVAMLPLVVGKDTFKSEMSAFQSESKWTNLSEILLLMKLSFHPDPNHQTVRQDPLLHSYKKNNNKILHNSRNLLRKVLSCSGGRIMHLIFISCDQIGWKWRYRTENLPLVKTNLQIWNRCQFGKFSAPGVARWIFNRVRVNN